MKKKFIDAFIETAEVFSKLSTAIKLKVGCVIVKDERIISIGYNGTPSGWDNNCENKIFIFDQLNNINEQYPLLDEEGRRYRLETKSEVIHAEMNALMKLAKTNESGMDSTMFITHAPCMNCAKCIFQAGIKKVYYRNSYRSTDGLDFLNKCNVDVEKC